MTPHLLRDGATTSEVSEATLLVEGRTAEEALEKVHRDVGEDARIIQAEKVRRGGVGGFFAREMVQLTVASEQDDAVDAGMAEPLFAQPSAPAPAAPAPAPAVPAPAPALAPEDPLDPVLRMAAAADADEMTFGEALRSALGTSVPRGDDAPAPAVGAALPEIITGGVPEITTLEPTPEVVAAPSTPAGATGPSTPRRAHWATAASRAGMRSLAVGAEALATTRVAPDAEVEEVTAVAPEPVTIDLDVLGATALAPTTVEPAPPTPTPTPRAVPTATEPAAPRTTATAPSGAPTPRWSRDRLLRAGLSDGLVDDVVAAAPGDDLAWMHALARAVEPLVRPAPEGDCVYVGGRVERHAKGTGAALCRPTDTTVPTGSLAMARRPGPAVRAWLDTTAGGRWLHLVVGGEGWREWLWEQPAAVSWATLEDLPVALGIARSLGLPLVGTVDVDGPVVASAVDIAMAIRTMLERP